MMAVVYVLARSYEGRWEWLAWVRAFSEAGMVGGLADWFAVTALFRHPMGLPIPHTAIIKKEKSRIGAVLARFIRRNFLSDEVTRQQWREWRPLGRVLGWMAAPENEKELQRLIAKLSGSLTAAFQKRQDESGSRAAEILRDTLTKLPVESGLGVAVRSFLASESRRAVMAPFLERLATALNSNRDYVIDEAGKEAPLQNTKIFGTISRVVTRVLSAKAMIKVSERLHDAAKDESHPIYDRIEESLVQLAEELAEGGAASREWEGFKKRVAEDPETLVMLEKLAKGAGRMLREDWLGEETGRLAGLVQETCARLETEGRLPELDEKASEWVAIMVQRHGELGEKWMSRIVDSWDAAVLIEKLETHIGADLQFIRINGTLIGGCVGVGLHAIGGVFG